MHNKVSKGITRIKTITIGFFVTLIATSSFLFFIPKTNASVLSFYFGGARNFNLVCTCSFNAMVFLYDYKSHTELGLVYQPGISKLYSNYKIFGSYLLGSYTPGAGICLMYAGTSCISIPSDGLLNSAPGTGTSMRERTEYIG